MNRTAPMVNRSRAQMPTPATIKPSTSVFASLSAGRLVFALIAPTTDSIVSTTWVDQSLSGELSGREFGPLFTPGMLAKFLGRAFGRAFDWSIDCTWSGPFAACARPVDYFATGATFETRADFVTRADVETGAAFEETSLITS
jgi:hypothetical protein